MIAIVEPTTPYAGIACACAIAWFLWKAWTVLSRPYRSPLRNLPGPPTSSWLYGNLKTIHAEDIAAPQERWAAEYGPNIVYRDFLGHMRLWTADVRAVNHILTHSIDYQKPEMGRKNLAKLIGEGVLSVEGEQHRIQRRVMNPAFGPSQIRELTEIFVQKAQELRDVWDGHLAQHGSPARINVLDGLTRMTLDAIGLAGFNYRFDSLNPDGKPNKLNEAFQAIFHPPEHVSTLAILKSIFPVLDVIPDAWSRRVKRARAVMHDIGMELVAEKKAAIRRELEESKEKAELGRSDMRNRDLLTLLLKANMASDIPDSQRLSDDDVLAQIPTFLVAGHETTSVATTWCLFALTQAPEVQRKLRDELFTLETETPTMDGLNSLPYLDAVVRETLRVHAPVPMSYRMAVKDDAIPVSEPFIDRNGQMQESIRVSKGNSIDIPILSLNRSKKLWGEDALEFKPERWSNPPESVSSIPGVWSHLLTFLGGPRACIGYRFSLVEMKALIFTLVRAFEFELAVPSEEIQKKPSVVQRPQLRSAPEQGSQMPLLVKRYIREQTME
ncbi:cytochrome P450 [Cubamyces sp. BRFM 1775]|nr:cytochrome P450 [Cubamyces sp. BRFM 1775]